MAHGAHQENLTPTLWIGRKMQSPLELPGRSIRLVLCLVLSHDRRDGRGRNTGKRNAEYCRQQFWKDHRSVPRSETNPDRRLYTKLT